MEGVMGGARVVRASAYFSDCETAIEYVCRGCQDENGYIDEAKPCGKDACPNMVAIYSDEPCRLTAHEDGPPTCPIRDSHQTKAGKAEWELYQRRMRGDWS